MAKNEVSNEIAIGLTLLSRTYCHLCHDMEEALAPIAAEFGAAVEVLDVDADDLVEAGRVVAVSRKPGPAAQV